MSRIPERNEKGSSPYSRHLKQSSFISQLQMQRKERIASIRPSRKQMSNSTLFDPDEEQTKVNTHSKKYLKEPQAVQEIDDELKRARSLKLISFQKPVPESGEKKASNELNQNVARLKVEQMTFKFKTKLAVLLKQIMVPLQELTKFSALAKIDEMLQFLSQKVKQKLTTQQITEVNIQKQLSKQKNALNNFEAQIESLKKKLQERQISQKTLKIKLKDTNNELRELYDKLNIKQKQLSAKVTELYQLKTTLKENEKILQSLQRKYNSLNEEAKVERIMFTDQSNDIIYSTKNILEENNKLLEKLKELQEQLQITEQKQRALTEINTQLNLEVKRWRQRFEDGSILQEEKQKRSLLDSINQKDFVQVLLVPSNELRKSTMSLHNQISSIDSSNRRVSLTALEIENLKLSSRVQDLERQNKQLNRDVVNYIAMKEHYQKTIAAAGQSSTSIRGEDSTKNIESLKENPINLQQISQQTQYQKKLEEVAKQWKDKLYEIVNNYEDELESIKTRVQQLTHDKQQLEKRLLEKTNEKYEVQKKLVQHEQQIYQLLKAYRNVNGLSLKQDKKEIEIHEDQKEEANRVKTMSFGSERQREKGESD